MPQRPEPAEGRRFGWADFESLEERVKLLRGESSGEFEGSRTLAQLENDDWGDPPLDATFLVFTAHRLRRVPVDELTTGDLRMLLGQEIGVEVLMPRALRALGAEPLLEGTFYPGDLLAAVLRQPRSYWRAHPAEWAEVARIVAELDPDRTEIAAEIAAFQATIGQRPGGRIH